MGAPPPNPTGSTQELVPRRVYLVTHFSGRQPAIRKLEAIWDLAAGGSLTALHTSTLADTLSQKQLGPG